MAGWAAAHAERPPARSPRPHPVRRAKPQRRVTGGVLWIGVLAILLAGVVAMNVAVLRLNMTLDRLGRERAALRTANSNLNSRISSNAAAPRADHDPGRPRDDLRPQRRPARAGRAGDDGVREPAPGRQSEGRRRSRS